MSRYPVEANAVGLVQHESQKLFMFSILWSDCNDILIYRTYDGFKDLSKSLAKKFPLEAGAVNKAERILPILKDASLLFRSKIANRHLERLRLLEIYSNQLLQTDSKISQCEDVIQFFSPNKQDLTPSFPENSIVIMPSDKDQKPKEVSYPPRSAQPPTTQPIIPETYICIDDFETKDTKNRLFKVQKYQCIDVLMKDPSGWWLVENEEKHLAWFPSPYLRKSGSLEEDNTKRKLFSKGTHYYAEKSYEAQNTDELSLKLGIVVEVIEQSETGWWLICYNGRFGYVPSMFLKPYENPHHKLQVKLDHKLSGSSPNLSKIVSNLDTGSSRQPKLKLRGKLDRMKSVSLDGLTDLSDSSDEVSGKSNRQRKVYVEWEMQDAEELVSQSMTGKPRSFRTEVFIHNCKDNMEKDDHVKEKEKKDSGFEEHVLPKILVTSDNSDPRPPLVPQRPTLQEIQTRCTAVTKEAALQARI